MNDMWQSSRCPAPALLLAIWCTAALVERCAKPGGWYAKERCVAEQPMPGSCTIILLAFWRSSAQTVLDVPTVYRYCTEVRAPANTASLRSMILVKYRKLPVVLLYLRITYCKWACDAE